LELVSFVRFIAKGATFLVVLQYAGCHVGSHAGMNCIPS